MIAHAERIDPDALANGPRAAAPPIFARSVFVGHGPFALLPHGDRARARADRVTPLLAAIAGATRHAAVAQRVDRVSRHQRRQGALDRSPARWPRASKATLRERGRARRRTRRGACTCSCSTAPPPTSAPASRTHGEWPLGIPRLRMPPRRAVALDAQARRSVRDVPGRARSRRLLRPGMRAVDLGRRAGRLDLAARAARASASPRSTTARSRAPSPATRSSRTCARTDCAGGRGGRWTGSCATSSSSRSASRSSSRAGSPTAPRGARSSISSCR